ncbi:MAG: hypothetical protein IPP48_15770 [Chitinophagaceae bacterium]|nr:hypothetical protein [Chitinophagaceae bacterium]
MKKTIILIAVLLGTQVALRAQTKIGYVSPDEIFALMPDVKAADVALAKYQEELAQAIKIPKKN